MGARNLNEWVNTSCFAPAPVGSVADDSGINALREPGTNQWNLSLYKKINFTERVYAQLRLEAYRVAEGRLDSGAARSGSQEGGDSPR
jgi:hypothetical protein